jgi:tetratricopeptide (TPR) repeat protein
MAWFSALTSIALLVVVGAAVGGFLLWRRRRKPPPTRAGGTSEHSALTPLRDLGDVERQAQQLEAEGDCERAAELYEAVGMLTRAIALYRQSGNIQKAAELELSAITLTKKSREIPVLAQLREETAEEADLEASLEAQDARPHHLPTREMPVAYEADVEALAYDKLEDGEPTGRFDSFDPGSIPRAGADDVIEEEPTVTYDLAKLNLMLDIPDDLLTASSEAPLDATRVPLGNTDPPPPRRKLQNSPPARAARPASEEPPARPEPRSVPPPRVPSERPRPKGPTVQELLGMLGPSPTPDLGNIEIYYRLGLLYLAEGNQDMARHAFVTVEDISPGYRDAGDYLEKLAPSTPPPERFAGRGAADNQNGRSVHNKSGVRGPGRFQEVRASATRGRRDER